MYPYRMSRNAPTNGAVGAHTVTLIGWTNPHRDSRSRSRSRAREPGPTTTVETPGVITKFSVGGAVEKAIDGVKRMHVEEGDLSNVTVTVRWSYAQIRELWEDVAAGGKPDDVPATIEMRELPGSGSAANWLSGAENEVGHDDVTIGAAAMVVIPKPPTSATAVGYSEGIGSTTIHFGRDPDAEAEGFELYVANAQDFAAGSTTMSGAYVIEDAEPQGIVLERDGTGVIYEGSSPVKFDVTAVPAREDLELQVRFDLDDVTGETVASRDNYIDKSIGTIPTGTDDTDKDTVTLTLDSNDANRDDDELVLHAEVVAYALDSGAYTDVGSKMEEITVIDIHKLPPAMVSPMTVEVTESDDVTTTLTYTINRNPPDTIVLPGEVLQYTTEALTIALAMDAMSTATSGDDYRVDAMVTVPEHSGKAADGWMQEVEVEVETPTDDQIEDTEVLILNATVTGNTAANGGGNRMDAEAVATVNIKDGTDTLVSVRDNAYDVIKTELGDPPMVYMGISGARQLTGANLFDYESDAVTVRFGTSVEGGGVTASAGDDGMITITGVAPSAGDDTKVTIEATATRNASSLVESQTKADIAQLTFPVTVVPAPLDALVVEVAAAPMEIMEGGMSTITATASRMIEASDEA